ncbi:hypothetical protein [Sphingomonas sp. CFBP 13720]|uniref:hypothetical protein n=1 Tax=Sphingomonas sp. CFBP 13720 TaxID=2775302 RepID=UPI0017825FD0|nr:hypothetical protein [Sphingomonas sp. CFBP 13720]MBD8679248.1 hypothetical protein [Sphingomonas sp. CFBP 13720]
MTNLVAILANDVIPHLRTVPESVIREVIQLNLPSIVIQAYHPIQAGEAISKPFELITRVIANDENIQLDMVRQGSDLTEEQIQALEPSALLAACVEVYDFLVCVYGTKDLTNILLDELWPFLPGLPRGAAA